MTLRTRITGQLSGYGVNHAGFGIFSAGAIADVVGVNPPYVQIFQGGLLGTVGGTAIAPGVPGSAVDATVAANETFSSGFAQGQLSCASAQSNPATCLPQSLSRQCPMKNFTHPTSWSGVLAWNISLDRQQASMRFYQLPLKFRNRSLAYALNDWQVSGTVFWHTGIPFSVLSTPYSADGNGIVNGSGPQFASVIPRVPLYEHKLIPGVTQPGTIQWLNPNAFVSTVDPSTGACYGGDNPKTCQFGNLRRNALRGPDFAWSDFYLTKWFP